MSSEETVLLQCAARRGLLSWARSHGGVDTAGYRHQYPGRTVISWGSFPGQDPKPKADPGLFEPKWFLLKILSAI